MSLKKRSFGSCSASLGGMGDKWLTWGKDVPAEGQGLEEIMQINYKMSFIKTVFQNSATLHVRFPLAVSWTLYTESHYKKSIFPNMSAKLVLKNQSLTRETLRKILQLVTFLKILLLSFFHIFKTSTSQSTSQWSLLEI